MNPVITNLFRLGLAFTLIVLTYLMLKRPGAEAQGFINDKVAHFIAFFCLACAAEGAFPKVKKLWKVLVLIGYGILIEFIQLNLGYRDFSWMDWLADIAGVLAYQPLIKPVNGMLLKLFPSPINNG